MSFFSARTAGSQELETTSPEAALPQTSGLNRFPDSFLYIEPFEIRHEILISFPLVESVIPIERADPSTLSVEEQQIASETIASWFEAYNPVMINREPAYPEDIRVSFFDTEIMAVQQVKDPEPVEVKETYVGIIMAYPQELPADTVTLEWNLFTPTISLVRSSVIHEDELKEKTLLSSDSTVEWTRVEDLVVQPITPVEAVYEVEKGWFSEKFVVSPTIKEETTEKILKNIYRAFRYKDDSKIYDELEKSVQGDLLTEIYLEFWQSVVSEQEGGAASRIKEVQLVDGVGNENVVLDGPGFLFNGTWHVTGTVEHWGHIHQRTNAYNAELTITEHEGHWKLSELTIRNKERLNTENRKR